MGFAISIRVGVLCAALGLHTQGSLLLSNDTPSEKNVSVGVSGPQQPAVSFTLPPEPFVIDSVTLSLRDYTSASDTPTIAFYTDDNGRPGNQIGSPLKNPFSGSNRSADFTFIPNGKVALAPGLTYWVLVSSSSGSFSWNASDRSVARTAFGLASLSSYKVGLNYGEVFVEDYPIPSFAIRATAVPEPSVLVLAGLGFLSASLWRRLKVRHID